MNIEDFQFVEFILLVQFFLYVTQLLNTLMFEINYFQININLYPLQNNLNHGKEQLKDFEMKLFNNNFHFFATISIIAFIIFKCSALIYSK